MRRSVRLNENLADALRDEARLLDLPTPDGFELDRLIRLLAETLERENEHNAPLLFRDRLRLEMPTGLLFPGLTVLTETQIGALSSRYFDTLGWR
jgi:hypothetical protein